jgi:CBS domain-containing protein
MNTEIGPVDLWPDDEPYDVVLEMPGPDRPADQPVATLVRPCVVVTEDEPVTAAWARIRQRGAHEGVVVDSEACCVGLLGLREVTEVWPVKPPLAAEPTAGDAVRGIRTTRINATTPIRVAARTLLTEQLGAAPVVGRDGRVVGLVTALDLLAALGGHGVAGHAYGPAPIV